MILFGYIQPGFSSVEVGGEVQGNALYCKLEEVNGGGQWMETGE